MVEVEVERGGEVTVGCGDRRAGTSRWSLDFLGNRSGAA